MKNLLTLIALFSCACILSAQETVPTVSTTAPQQIVIKPQHFGYLSYELKKSYDSEMERAEQDFSKKFAEYIDGQRSFPENIMLKRQKELQLLMQQSMQFKQEAQELLAKAEAELMAPVRDRLNEAIQAVGKKRNYAYVLNTDANAYPYISGEGEAENCTDAVLIQLGVK